MGPRCRGHQSPHRGVAKVLHKCAKDEKPKTQMSKGWLSPECGDRTTRGLWTTDKTGFCLNSFIPRLSVFIPAPAWPSPHHAPRDQQGTLRPALDPGSAGLLPSPAPPARPSSPQRPPGGAREHPIKFRFLCPQPARTPTSPGEKPKSSPRPQRPCRPALSPPLALPSSPSLPHPLCLFL